MKCTLISEEMKPNSINRNRNNTHVPEMPVIRHQANARERHRTHRFVSIIFFQIGIRNSVFSDIFSVNSAFITLRELIPTEPKTRKLSKIETLRLAKSYIEHLFAILITGNETKRVVSKVTFCKLFLIKFNRNLLQSALYCCCCCCSIFSSF